MNRRRTWARRPRWACRRFPRHLRAAAQVTSPGGAGFPLPLGPADPRHFLCVWCFLFFLVISVPSPCPAGGGGSSPSRTWAPSTPSTASPQPSSPAGGQQPTGGRAPWARLHRTEDLPVGGVSCGRLRSHPCPQPPDPGLPPPRSWTLGGRGSRVEGRRVPTGLAASVQPLDGLAGATGNSRADARRRVFHQNQTVANSSKNQETFYLLS